MPHENEDVLQKLGPSIVEIISDKGEGEGNSRTLGTGFVVTDDGFVVTCRHVIRDSQDNLMQSVQVRFHSDGKTETKKFTATPVKYDQDFKDDPSIDIAFLRLEKLPEIGVTPVKLDDKVVSLNHFASIGFKKAEEFTRLGAEGKIRILTQFKISKDVLSPEVIQLYSPDNEIEPGMSGAPVLDIERDRVVGIITERYIEPYNRGASNNLAFALPVIAMIELYPMLRQKNRGLEQIFEFLRKVDEEGITKYERIQELYVPPINYDEIEKALSENKVVFITGTPEYGKTYTAVNLLWEYFKKGYEPVWFKGGEGKEQRTDVRKNFGNVERYLKPRHIIYFEDPFGRTEYEVSSDERILRNMATLIATVKKNRKSTYVIITSREEVFKAFERKILDDIELRKYELKLSVKTPSYNYQKRKQMLLNHASVMNCKWLIDEDLNNSVLEAIQHDRKLPTPLNIEQFVAATSDEVLDRESLLRQVEATSIGTLRSFGQEIGLMPEDKIIFLSFPFISARFPVELAESNYQELISELDIRDSWEFSRLRDWFKDGDKVNITYHDIERGSTISFSHPSYLEAMRISIFDQESGRLTKVGETICNVLIKLADNSATGLYVAYAVLENYDKLPEGVRNLIFKLADSKLIAADISYAIVGNDEKIPNDVRNKLLEKLSANEVAGVDIASRLAYDPYWLPENLRNDLLMRLSDKEESAHEIYNDILNGLFVGVPTRIKDELIDRIDRNHEKTGRV